MSAPRILPKGNDRSWTRGFYYGINRMFRRMWWQHKLDEKVNQAVVEAQLYGKCVYRIGWGIIR